MHPAISGNWNCPASGMVQGMVAVSNPWGHCERRVTTTVNGALLGRVPSDRGAVHGICVEVRWPDRYASGNRIINAGRHAIKSWAAGAGYLLTSFV